MEAAARADARRVETEAWAVTQETTARVDAEAQRIRTEAEVDAVEARRTAARVYAEHPELMRLEELTTLKELAKTTTARLYLSFPGTGIAPPGTVRD
jgi:regulator of protease activity HflC (stomatin/prohibitin superfamily)